jgi:hypothetical protein
MNANLAIRINNDAHEENPSVLSDGMKAHDSMDTNGLAAHRWP